MFFTQLQMHLVSSALQKHPLQHVFLLWGANVIEGLTSCIIICPFLHWLPVWFQVWFKVLVITYEALQGIESCYLRNHLSPIVSIYLTNMRWQGLCTLSPCNYTVLPIKRQEAKFLCCSTYTLEWGFSWKPGSSHHAPVPWLPFAIFSASFPRKSKGKPAEKVANHSGKCAPQYTPLQHLWACTNHLHTLEHSP